MKRAIQDMSEIVTERDHNGKSHRIRIIHLPSDMNPEMLKIVCLYLEYHHSNPTLSPTTIPKPVPENVNLHKWETEIMSMISYEQLIEMIKTCEFFGLCELSHLCSAKLAYSLRGKTSREMERVLHIKPKSNSSFPGKNKMGLDACKSQWNANMFGDPGLAFWRNKSTNNRASTSTM